MFVIVAFHGDLEGGLRVYPLFSPALSHPVRYACVLFQYSFPDLDLGARRHVDT